MILRIKEGDKIISETPHSQRHEKTIRMDIEAYNLTLEKAQEIGQRVNELPRSLEVYAEPSVKTLAELKTDLKNKISRASFARVEKIYPAYVQRNVGLGIYDSEKSDSIINCVKAHRQAVKDAEVKIDSAKSPADLEKIEVDWP